MLKDAPSRGRGNSIYLQTILCFLALVLVAGAVGAQTITLYVVKNPTLPGQDLDMQWNGPGVDYFEIRRADMADPFNPSPIAWYCSGFNHTDANAISDVQNYFYWIDEWQTPPVADAGPDVQSGAVIGGTPTSIDGIGPFTYAWLPTSGLSDPADPNPVATPVADTDYTVTVTDEGAPGCISQDTVHVTVVSAMEVTIPGGPVIDTICSYPGAVQLEAMVTGGTPPFSFSWDPPADLDDPLIANPTVLRPLALTDYTVTVTDSLSDQAQATVTVNPQWECHLTGDCTPDFTLDDHDCNPWTLHDQVCMAMMIQWGDYLGDLWGQRLAWWAEGIDPVGPSIVEQFGSDGFLYVEPMDDLIGGGPYDCLSLGTLKVTDGLDAILLDDTAEAAFYLYGSGGLPQTTFIDRQGRIRYHENGLPMTFPSLFTQYIVELIGE